jgi:hypothetical protein
MKAIKMIPEKIYFISESMKISAINRKISIFIGDIVSEHQENLNLINGFREILKYRSSWYVIRLFLEN